MRTLLRSPGVRLLVLVASFLLILWLAFLLRSVLTPFAVAFGIAYFLNPAVGAIEHGLSRTVCRARPFRSWLDPRTAAVALLAAALVVVVVVVLLIVVPTVVEQVSETVAKLPAYMKSLRATIEPLYQRLNLQYPEQAEQVRLQVEEALRTHLPQILAPIPRLVRSALSSALGFVLTLLNFVVVPVFAFYLLHDMNRIRDGARDLVPLPYREYVYGRMGRVDRLLSAFVRGQVTVCLILGSFYAVALTLCGVPMGLLVGFVIGFFNLVPFMSYVLGLPLALLLAWIDHADLHRLLLVAGIFTFGQFVEGNFITPRIVGESLGLHAVVIMLAVLVGGELFGFIGMLLAVPVTAALSVFWADLRDLYLRSDFYRGGGPRTIVVENDTLPPA